MFESVDLPAPFSPRSACTSPSAASKWTPSFATTPGNRLVMSRSSTAAGIEKGRTGPKPRPPVTRLALRAPDDSLHEVAHRHQVAVRRLVARLDLDLALLVVDRAAELVPLAALDQLLLCCDQRLRLRGDAGAERCELREPVLQAAVVGAGLPGSVHRSLGPLEVVRAPVVDRGCEPLLRREALRVGVVADPRDADRLRVLAGRRAVDVLSEDVGTGGLQVLGGLLLLRRIEPRVRPDDPHLRARMRLLDAESERIRVPDHLGNRKRHDVPDGAALRCRAGGDAGQVDRVLT